MMTLSIIIPTLNEARYLPRLLGSLRLLRFFEPEIIVVDGGSTDDTREIAKKAGAIVASCPIGRGGQLRHGASIATGEFFLFLHADSVLTEEAAETIRTETIERGFEIGVFRLLFDSSRWIYRLFSFFSRFESFWTTFGDQGILVNRKIYDRAGGFPEQPLLEDVEFFRHVREGCRITKFRAGIVTSVRRFERGGPLRTQLKNSLMLFRYRNGATAGDLADHYRPHEPHSGLGEEPATEKPKRRPAGEATDPEGKRDGGALQGVRR